MKVILNNLNPELLSNGILIIGDVHGKTKEYNDIIKKHNGYSIQVGDFGFKKEHSWHLENVDFDLHKICFGNHDDTTFLNSPHSLGNFSWWPEIELMTIRGAWSIDKQYRIENVDWWKNEEMAMNEIEEVVDFYIENKPKIVISHDCPHFFRKGYFNINEKTLTSNAMNFMFDEHKPHMWIFGHHHKNFTEFVDNTQFQCLGELSQKTILF